MIQCELSLYFPILIRVRVTNFFLFVQVPSVKTIVAHTNTPLTEMVFSFTGGSVILVEQSEVISVIE